MGDSSVQMMNRLRERRLQAGLSQQELARRVGLTRQAIYAIELNKYLPSTEVSLKLARLFHCSVEELFSLDSLGEVIQAELVGELPDGEAPIRGQVARVGKRTIVRPICHLGEMLNFTVPADGLIRREGGIHASRASQSRVSVQLFRDRQSIERTIIVGGCDPSIFLVGGHVPTVRGAPLVTGWTMGSVAALEALKQGHVHIAGLHIHDPSSRMSNIPFLKQQLRVRDYTLVRFATWEQGLIVKRGNPKRIRDIGDLANRGVRMVNREPGAGARLLCDGALKRLGIQASRIRGYDHIQVSHLHVARVIAEGHADVGVGVRSSALLFGLDFVPLQEEHYDLVIPNSLLKEHPTIQDFLDTLSSRSFRMEIDALGGYDVGETGAVIDWTSSPS